jgi:hypothetical protein
MAYATASSGLMLLLGSLPLRKSEVRNKFDNTRNTSGTTDQDDFMDVRFVNLGVAEDLLDRFKRTMEEILAALFEMGTGEGSVEVNTLEEGVDSMEVWAAEERVRLARSQAVHRRRTAQAFEERSV